MNLFEVGDLVMKVIGLTGGIASGKSTVSKALEKLGAVRIDTDQLAHQAIEPDKPAWEDIVETYGQGVLNVDRTINRRKLGEIVFDNPVMLIKLNHITHKRIKESINESLHNARVNHPDAIVILEVPLLYETNLDKICDEVWVVYVERETQIRRLMEKEGFNRENAVKRIDSQMLLEEKVRRADLVIDNNGEIEETIATATKYYNDIIQKA